MTQVIQLTPMTYAELRTKLIGAGFRHLVTVTGIVGEALNLGRVLFVMDAAPPTRKLPADARPVILYFATDEDREVFVKGIQAGMNAPKEIKLP